MLRRLPPSPLVVLQSEEVARRVGGNWTRRAGTFRMTWTLNDLVAADGLRLRVEFSASIELLPERAEQAMFAETFGPSDAVAEGDLRRHFEPALRAAAGRFAGSEPAAALVDPAAKARWANDLKTSAEAIAFGCGLRVSAPVQVVAGSDELDRRRRTEAQRVQNEHDAEGRLATARHTTAMLREWQSVHEQYPSVTPGELLGRLAPADQAAAVTDVLAATAVTAARFWAVAGNSLIRLDWNDVPAAPVVFPVPAALGPLRSVRTDADKLLLGAQRGVWIMNAAEGSVTRQLILADLHSEHGFTAVVEAGGLVWASHRESGLVAWDERGEPSVRLDLQTLGGPPAAMHRSRDGSSVVVAVDQRLLWIDAAQKMSTVWTGAAPIMAAMAADGLTDVICKDGTAVQLNESFDVISTRITVARAVAAARLPWLWSHRLLVVGEDGSLRCFGLHDDIVTQYAAPQGVGRAIAVSGGKIVATSADRNCILGWNVDDGRSLRVQLLIGTLARARAADLEAGTAAR